MAVDAEGRHWPDKVFAYWTGRRGAVWLIAWIRTDHGWWAWIRWVEPFIVDGVSQGGMDIDLCVPGVELRRDDKVTDDEYRHVKRVDGRGAGHAGTG